MVLIASGTVNGPTFSASSTAFSASHEFDFGPAQEFPVFLAVSLVSRPGLTSISITGGTPSATIGIVYAEIYGVQSQDERFGTESAWVTSPGGEWTGGAVTPLDKPRSGIILGVVYASTANSILNGTHDYQTILQFSPSSGGTIAMEYLEVRLISGSYSASGTSNLAGVGGSQVVLWTSGFFETILWARSAI
jgi:hypothetical protein